ncbi:uncharacterized protein LOC117334226 [Pecten maximus]|uniref:uncharacterized protein LOC117334226 n=1 Tax=Pecten maximus TaxID=6579 RepID=UPI001458175F|nr:uncharacterized protein LOC117334226 [Pecten maximus]
MIIPKNPMEMWINIFLCLCGISSLHGGGWGYTPPEGIGAMCAANVTRDTSVPCDYSSRREQYWRTSVNDDQPCKLKIKKRSLDNFQRKYTHLKFNFAQLLLKFRINDTAVSVSSTKCVIQPLNWAWTHRGQKGAYKALFWPRDYSILSLGTLKRNFFGPYCVFIDMQGNCSSFVIGEMNTTLAIVHALSELIPEKKTDHLPFGMVEDTNMWCYTKMVNITDTMRSLCRYTICPQNTVGYSCCKHDFHTKSLHCNGEPFRYFKFWWELPYVIGSVVFLFFPLFFIAISDRLYRILRNQKSMSYKPNEQEGYEWISENHVCFSAALFSPFQGLVIRHMVAVSRFVRFAFSLCTVFITAIYLIVVWKTYSLRLFHIDLVKNHVTTDVNSMLSGFEMSRQNFLTLFGGPYVAFSMFLLLFAALLSVPKSLAILLESGLPDPSPEHLSPLCVDMNTVSTLGSTQSLHTTIGYNKIYRTLLAQMAMLFNPEFWRFVLKCQIKRWISFSEYSSPCKFRVFLVYFVTLPVFAVTCVLEWITCILYYGLPIVFVNVIVYRAYCSNIKRYLRSTNGSITKHFTFLFICLIAIVLLYCCYILHILFVYSFVLVARTAIFTYTGFVAYPEHYRNYLICYLSVAIYIVESIRSMKLTYDELFDQTKLVCDIMMDDVMYNGSSIIKTVESKIFIPQRLFNFVISHQKPLRIETFLMFFRLLITIMVIYMSVVMLVIFDTFDHMNVLTEIGTTVVICMAPKVLRSAFKCSGYSNEVEERQTIKLWVVDYLNEFTSNMDRHVQERDKSMSLAVL